MIIVLKREATEETAQEILGRIEEKGLKQITEAMDFVLNCTKW